MKTVVIEEKEYQLKHAGQSGPRQHPAWAVGDVEHQGDVIVVCIGELPKGAKRSASWVRDLILVVLTSAANAGSDPISIRFSLISARVM